MATALDSSANAATSETDDRWSRLPAYVRSLLKIDVALAVKLAQKRLSLGQILELAPGSMIQFEHRYDEPVRLMIGNHTIAEGDVVKVGDRFGIRISSIVLPSERFARVHADQGLSERADNGVSST